MGIGGALLMFDCCCDEVEELVSDAFYEFAASHEQYAIGCILDVSVRSGFSDKGSCFGLVDCQSPTILDQSKVKVVISGGTNRSSVESGTCLDGGPLGSSINDFSGGLNGEWQDGETKHWSVTTSWGVVENVSATCHIQASVTRKSLACMTEDEWTAWFTSTHTQGCLVANFSGGFCESTEDEYTGLDIGHGCPCYSGVGGDGTLYCEMVKII